MMRAMFIGIIESLCGETMKKKIILACTKCSSRNYTTNKNQTTSPERLTIKKFCKHCKEHAEHRETK